MVRPLVAYSLLVASIHCSQHGKILQPFMDNFHFPSKHVNIDLEGYSAEKKVSMIKRGSKNDLRVRFTYASHEEDFLLIIGNTFPSNKFKINKQVYLLNNEFEVFESYYIKDRNMTGKLGQFIDSKYIPEVNIEQDFLKRRSNFQGVQFTALTESNGVKDKMENLENCPFDIIEDRYDVTCCLDRGVGYHILMELQKSLNFTTRIFKRRSVGWGVPKLLENGTISLKPGMVKDVMEEKAEMIAAELAMISERFLVLDFLMDVPIDNFATISTRKNDLNHSFDWNVFKRPLEWKTWIAVITVSLIVSLVFAMTTDTKQITKIWSAIVQSNFAVGSFDEWLGKSWKLNLIILVSLMSGNIIWISYNAYLTSSLTVTHLQLPFQDLETFLSSDYEYVFLFPC